MSKIFETNFENGSALPKIALKTYSLLSNASFKVTDKGITNLIKGGAIGYRYQLNYDINNKDFTIIFWIRPINIDKSSNIVYTLFDNITASNGLWIYYYNSGNTSHLVYQYSNGTSYDWTIPNSYNLEKKWTFLKFTRINNIGKFDLNNGQLISSNSPNLTVTQGSTVCNILGNVAPYYLNGYYGKAIFYDSIIAQKETSDRYIDFLNAKPINKPIISQPNLSILEPVVIQEQGLVAAYSFRPVGNKLPNISWDNISNGFNARQYDGTCNKTQVLPDRLKLKTSNVSLNNSIILKRQFTICVIQYWDGTSCANPIVFTSGGMFLEIRSVAGDTYFYKGVGETVQYACGWSPGLKGYHTIIVSKNGINLKTYLDGKLVGSGSIGSDTIDFSISSIGRPGGIDYTFDLNNWKCYSRILSEQEIKNYHNQFASKVVLFEDFSQYSIGATKINNWYLSGTASITEEITNNSIVKLGSKLLNINSGEAYTQSSAAYGTWEWKVKFTSLPIGFYNGVQFIASEKKTSLTNIGYSITPSVTISSGIIDSIIIDKGQPHGFGGSIIKTVPANLTTNVWYRFKVTRSNDNLFKLYINDKVITTFTDSTYITSKYFGFSKPYFNKYYTDIKITQGIIV